MSAYSELGQEVTQTFDRVDDIITGPQLSSCIYLLPVINETIRMSPPGVAEGIREVLPGVITVQGHFIKEGLNVRSALYALQHHQEMFGDPCVFRPKRSIVSESVSAANITEAQSAFFPFSLSSGACLGKRVVYQKIEIAIERVVFRGHFEAVVGDMRGLGRPESMWARENKTQWQVDDALVVARDGPLIRFNLRPI